MKRIFISAIILLAGAVIAFSCEMNISLVEQGGARQRILPGSQISLTSGKTYTLEIEFVEDHRNCAISPEETAFLLDGEKWKANKTSQPLILQQAIVWTSSSRTRNSASLPFTAAARGSWELEIIRECPKGGYDEVFTFAVNG